MPIFTIKKKDEPAQPKSPPVDQVIQMKQQGLSDNQIIQTLQRAGYDPQMIFDAMNQSEIKGAVEGPQEMETMPQMEPTQQQEYPQMQQAPRTEEIEEIAEAIIDEKWTELMQSVGKIVEWKETINSKFAELQQRIESVENNVKQINASVLERVGDYDKKMTDVGTELKAMSKVFQKILPGFMENVSELSRITENLKDKKSRSQSKKEDEEESIEEKI